MAGLVSRSAKWLLPTIVSFGAFALLLNRIDFRVALARVDAHVALVLVPIVLVYGGLSLWIEAESLNRLVSGPRTGAWTCAKVKAASYPLALIHYALGAAGLAVLLRRRGGMGIGDAAGIVMLIALFDLGLLLLLSALGVTLLSSQATAVQAGVVVAAVVGVGGGFTFLRTSMTLGQLERIRRLELFRAAREAPARLLGLLGLLRLCFVVSFIALAGAALAAFEIQIPLGDLVVGVTVVSLVAALPIAVSGLGTGQVAFVYVFRHWSDPETLLACSLALSAVLIVMRAGLGLLFAREFTREAWAAAREASA